MGKRRQINSFNVQIWCGLKVRYSGKVFPIKKAEQICQKYCDEVGFCVSITPTKYIYSFGSEKGFVIGIIAYPRFPKRKSEILKQTITLAEQLQKALKQMRVTITTPTKSIMI